MESQDGTRLSNVESLRSWRDDLTGALQLLTFAGIPPDQPFIEMHRADVIPIERSDLKGNSDVKIRFASDSPIPFSPGASRRSSTSSEATLTSVNSASSSGSSVSSTKGKKRRRPGWLQIRFAEREDRDSFVRAWK